MAVAFVISRGAHTVLPARLIDLGSHLNLLEDDNDLAFTEFNFLHPETPLVGILYSQLDQVFKVTSTVSTPKLRGTFLTHQLQVVPSVQLSLPAASGTSGVTINRIRLSWRSPWSLPLQTTDQYLGNIIADILQC